MSDDMSMIPYNAGHLDVVLRHNDSVVVFDHDSQQLVLRNTTESDAGADVIDENFEPANCPLCHQPVRESRGRHHSNAADLDAEFVNPNYFRMLNNSLPSSTSAPPSPSSPRRILPQAGSAQTPEAESLPRSSHAQGISSAAFSQGYFKKFFVEEKILGKGGKGVVLLVKHMLDGVSLGHYACKRVPVGDDHEWLEKVLGEVQLLQHLSHQNLVSYRHVWLENTKLSLFGPSVPCAYILQQYCNAGDLHEYICGAVSTTTTAQELKERRRRKSRGEQEVSQLFGIRTLQLDEIYSFFRDITSGLRHLHINGYIHRDLKPNNCLLHITGDGIRVLVSDFGEVQSQDAIRKSTGATGTISYCAPEVLQQDYPGGPFGNFTFKSDIFSLGMILYFLCFGGLPYVHANVINEEKEDLDQLREEITGWTGFSNPRSMRPDLPQKLYTFLQRLLSVDPGPRPTAEEVLNGIQVGSNSAENFRFRANSTVPDLPGGLFQPLKKAERALSPRKNLNRTHRSPHRNSVAFKDLEYDSELTDPNDGTRSHQDPIFEVEETTSKDRDLVVRPGYAGPPIASPIRSSLDTQSLTPPQQLLPPPPSRFPALDLLRTPFSGLQMSLFLIKIGSIIHPCSPLTANPWTLYPLLLLAAATLRSYDLRVQALAMVTHLLIVFLGMRLGFLCAWHTPAIML